MIQKLKSKLNTKEGKTLTANFLSLSALQVTNFIFPLITLPYLARVLGVEKFGVLALASSIVIYFTTLTDYGFNYTAVRETARNKDDIDYLSKLFSTVLFSRILLMLISLLTLILLICFIPYLRQYTLILFCAFSVIPFNILFPEWFFRGVEDMKFITILNLISKLLFTMLIFVVIKTEEDYYWQPLLTSFGYLFSGIIAQYIISVKYKVKIQWIGFSKILATLKQGYNMFMTILLPNMYTSFSIILLNAVSGSVANGIFDGGNKFLQVSQRVPDVLSKVFFPFLARRGDKHSFFAKINLAINFLISIFLYFGADILVRIFLSPEFSDSATVIRIMAISPVFLSLMNTYGTNYLVLIGKEKLLHRIVLICSIIGLFCAVVLVYYFSYIGVACAISITSIIRGLTTYYFYKKNNK